MIDIVAIGGLHVHAHEREAYCYHFDHGRVLDLERMFRTGQGSRRLPLAVRCRQCGERGTIQVRPPMPVHSSTGWIAPPVL